MKKEEILIMTSMKKSLTLFSAALLISSGLSLSMPNAVRAEDGQTDKVTAETSVSQVSVEATMRGTEPYIDATIATSQPVSHSAQATVMLQDANGNTITSWVYTMNPGQRRFTAWFDLSGQKSNDYRVAVVQDKETVASGQSASVHFDQSKTKKSPASNEKKPSTAQQPNQVNTTTAVVGNSTAGRQQSDSTNQVSSTNANQHVTTSKALVKKANVSKTTTSKEVADDKDDKMLTDREDDKAEPKKGFPWLLSGLVAVVALSLFLVIQKVSKRK